MDKSIEDITKKDIKDITNDEIIQMFFHLSKEGQQRVCNWLLTQSPELVALGNAFLATSMADDKKRLQNHQSGGLHE